MEDKQNLVERLIVAGKIPSNQISKQFPEYNSLIDWAKELKSIVDTFSKTIEKENFIAVNISFNLELFIIDVQSELHYDYKKRNKRYSEKWYEQYKNLREIEDNITNLLSS